jgi:hypothetical protein
MCMKISSCIRGSRAPFARSHPAWLKSRVLPSLRVCRCVLDHLRCIFPQCLSSPGSEGQSLLQLRKKSPEGTLPGQCLGGPTENCARCDDGMLLLIKIMPGSHPLSSSPASWGEQMHVPWLKVYGHGKLRWFFSGAPWHSRCKTYGIELPWPSASARPLCHGCNPNKPQSP